MLSFSFSQISRFLRLNFFFCVLLNLTRLFTLHYAIVRFVVFGRRSVLPDIFPLQSTLSEWGTTGPDGPSRSSEPCRGWPDCTATQLPSNEKTARKLCGRFSGMGQEQAGGSYIVVICGGHQNRQLSLQQIRTETMQSASASQIQVLINRKVHACLIGNRQDLRGASFCLLSYTGGSRQPF